MNQIDEAETYAPCPTCDKLHGIWPCLGKIDHETYGWCTPLEITDKCHGESPIEQLMERNEKIITENQINNKSMFWLNENFTEKQYHIFKLKQNTNISDNIVVQELYYTYQREETLENIFNHARELCHYDQKIPQTKQNIKSYYKYRRNILEESINDSIIPGLKEEIIKKIIRTDP